MARIRVFIVLTLAVAAGGTFAFGTYRYMQNVPTRTSGRPRLFRPVRSRLPRS
jgi:hypothetical protein